MISSVFAPKGAQNLQQAGAENSAQSNTRTARQILFGLRGGQVDPKNPKKRVYNPYASDGIKHFENLSRSEIDKLMVKIKRDKDIRKQQ